MTTRDGELDPVERLIEAISRQGTKVKGKVSEFRGNLDIELLIDCLQELERYFNMNNMEEEDPRRVKFAARKM